MRAEAAAFLEKSAKITDIYKTDLAGNVINVGRGKLQELFGFTLSFLSYVLGGSHTHMLQELA